MDLYVWLNNGTENVSTHIQGWSSLVWTEGYQEESTFEVRFAPGAFTKNTLPMHTLLTLGDTRYVQVVLQRELKDGQLIVSGEGFDSWVLKRRSLGVYDSWYGHPTYYAPNVNGDLTWVEASVPIGMEDYIGNPWRPERAAELALLTVASYNRADNAAYGPWRPSRKYLNSTSSSTPSNTTARYSTSTFTIPNSTVTTDFTSSDAAKSEDRTWDSDATLYDEVSELLIEAGGWVRFLRPSRVVSLPVTSGTFVGHQFSWGSRSQWTPGLPAAPTFHYWPRQVTRTTEVFGAIYTMSQWNVFDGTNRRNVLYDALKGDLSDEILVERSNGLYTGVGYKWPKSKPQNYTEWSDYIQGDPYVYWGKNAVSTGHLSGFTSSGKHKPEKSVPNARTYRLTRKSRPKTEYGAMVNNSRFVYNVDYAIGDRVRVRTSFGEIEDALVGSTTRYETRNEGYSVSHKLIFD